MKAMKYLPILLAVCLSACNNYEINPEQAEGFLKFFTSTLSESGVDVKPASDGGYIAVGTSTDVNTGLSNIYLIKTDCYGNEESWSPVIIGGDMVDEVATSLQVVSDGYVILGYSNDPAGGNGGYDLYLVKTDLQGNTVWETYAGDSGDEYSGNLIALSSGGFLASGTTSSFTGVGAVKAYWTTFDASGNQIKSSYRGVGGETVFETSIIEAASDYVLCSSIGTIDPEVSRIMVITIDKGNLYEKNVKYLWSDIGTNLYAKCIQEMAGGNLVICGTIYTTSGIMNVYLQEITPDLVPVWSRTLSEEDEPANDLAASSMRITSDNNLAIVGTRTETDNDDLFLMIADPGGNQTGFMLFGDDGFQRGSALEIAPSDNGWIMVGTNGFEDQSMMALIKTDGQGIL